jgi:hypothetical protein
MNAMSDEGEKFLSRWSRLKRHTKVAEADSAETADLAQGAESTAAPLQRQEKVARAESVPPQLPPVDELTLDSDFRGFFHPKVDEIVKRAALKKLFSDPHFNVMDGLDTYIDDYSISDPLPAEMLAQMKSAQKIFKWARNELEEGETAPTPTPAAAAPVAALDESTPHANATPPIASGALTPEARLSEAIPETRVPDVAK